MTIASGCFRSEVSGRINMAVAKAVARSTFGIEAFMPHDLRRSFATHAEASGISPFIIGHVLYYASVARATVTSKVYAR